jgi:acyl-CoA synthetase (NDP forming)
MKELTIENKNHNDKLSLEYLFHPKSIAVVGVSTDTTRIASGQIFLRALLDTKFKGKVYPVSREEGKILGLKIYSSIRDIPDTVDYVISAIPAQDIPQLIIDCATKRVKAIHIFTAGFSEIADEDGERRQSQITAMARQRNISIIGPNCMGLYCPKTGLAFHPDMPKESGTIAFLSQSGGNAIYAIREAASRGICFSKVISYGNACDLNESDFLEYLTHDPETEVIAAYIEGVKDGTRLVEALKQASRVKPVIVYKGGTTESGTRAVSSHTGAIAGSNRVWDGLLKQVGAIQVYSMEELLDILMLFRYMSPPEGRATAVIGIGGGNSVRAADACSSAGLTVPLLPTETRGRLEEIYASEVGGSFRNPVDTYFARWDLLQETIKIVADCDQIDLLILHITIGFAGPKYETRLNLIKPYVESISSVTRVINKPVAIVLYPIGLAKFEPITAEEEVALYKAGLSVFPLVGQAARAITKFIEYQRQ